MYYVVGRQTHSNRFVKYLPKNMALLAQKFTRKKMAKSVSGYFEDDGIASSYIYLNIFRKNFAEVSRGCLFPTVVDYILNAEIKSKNSS